MKKDKTLVLVPHCVKDLECRAEVVQDELICKRKDCDKYTPSGCALYNLLSEAENFGLIARVVKKDDCVPRILEEEKPEVVIGMTCARKIKKITPYVESLGIKVYSLPLINQSCFKLTGVPSRYSFGDYQTLLSQVG